MKTIFVVLILFWAINLPSTGELTVQDLDKIRSIVDASEQDVKEEIAGSEKRTREYIAGSEKRTREYIAGSEKQTREYIDLKVNSVEKQIILLTNFVYALIALIVVAIGIPQILIAWRSIKSKPKNEQFAEPIEQM